MPRCAALENGHEEIEISAAFSSEDGRAVDVSLGDSRLGEIIMFGNGKDAELELQLADGREFKLEICSLTITCDGAMSSSVRRYDDRNVVVRYSCAGLRISSMQVASDLEKYDYEFVRDVQDWVDGGFESELNYVVHVCITLTGLEG
jgi:hypothetical protein